MLELELAVAAEVRALVHLAWRAKGPATVVSLGLPRACACENSWKASVTAMFELLLVVGKDLRLQASGRPSIVLNGRSPGSED